MFYNLQKTEFKRSIFNTKFVISVMIGTFFCYYGLTDYFLYDSQDFGIINQVNAYRAWFTAMGIGNRSFYILLVPVLATLPSAYLLLEERESGHLKNIITRVSYKNYFKCKLFTSGISGGLACALPPIIIFIICIIMYPAGLPNTPANTWGFHPEGLFENIYIYHPNIFILLNCLLIFIFGFTYSTIGVTISLFVNKKILVILIPLIFYTFFNMVLEFFEAFTFSPKETVFPWLSARANFISVYGELIIILFVCIAICTSFNRKEKIY